MVALRRSHCGGAGAPSVGRQDCWCLFPFADMCLNYLNQVKFEFYMGLCRELVPLESVIGRCPEFKYLNLLLMGFVLTAVLRLNQRWLVRARRRRAVVREEWRRVTMRRRR